VKRVVFHPEAEVEFLSAAEFYRRLTGQDVRQPGGRRGAAVWPAAQRPIVRLLSERAGPTTG